MTLIPAFKIGIWNAWIFMSVFLLQMLTIMFIDKRARERSHIPREARRGKLEKYSGIIGNAVWLAAMAYSVFLPLQRSSYWFYIGLLIITIGIILLAAATSNFITTPSDQLIAKGVYRFSRHPMYLATFFICMGTGIVAISWLFMLLSAIMICCLYVEALIEERYCLEKYNGTYREYMNRVPRWFGIPGKNV